MPENRTVTTSPVDVELIQRTLHVFEILAREVDRNVNTDEDPTSELVDGIVPRCQDSCRMAGVTSAI